MELLKTLGEENSDLGRGQDKGYNGSSKDEKKGVPLGRNSSGQGNELTEAKSSSGGWRVEGRGNELKEAGAASRAGETIEAGSISAVNLERGKVNAESAGKRFVVVEGARRKRGREKGEFRKSDCGRFGEAFAGGKNHGVRRGFAGGALKARSDFWGDLPARRNLCRKNSL